MGKWNIHRPAKRVSTTPLVFPTSSNNRKSSTGRRVFHDPGRANPPEGHGWHSEEGQRWTCDYGCKSFVWSRDPQPGQYHAWNCPYWHNEGRTLSPF